MQALIKVHRCMNYTDLLLLKLGKITLKLQELGGTLNKTPGFDSRDYMLYEVT